VNISQPTVLLPIPGGPHNHRTGIRSLTTDSRLLHRQELADVG